MRKVDQVNSRRRAAKRNKAYRPAFNKQRRIYSPVFDRAVSALVNAADKSAIKRIGLKRFEAATRRHLFDEYGYGELPSFKSKHGPL